MARLEASDAAGSFDRSLSVRPSKSGGIVCGSSGAPPTGSTRKRQNELIAARLAFLILNEWGEEWEAVRAEEDQHSHVDIWCEAPGRLQPIQVTVLPHEPSIWRRFARDGHIVRTYEPSRHAEEIINAIRAKAERYPAVERENLLLVLDGSWFMNYALAETLIEYTRQHLTEARASGFGDIFLLTSFHFHNLLNPPAVPQAEAA